MKTGRRLQEVMLELDRQNKAKKDYIGSAQALRLYEDGQTFEIGSVGEARQFGTTRLFHRQVASALGIPAKYYDLMQTRKPELLAQNVNAWVGDRGNSYRIRTRTTAVAAWQGRCFPTGTGASTTWRSPLRCFRCLPVPTNMRWFPPK